MKEKMREEGREEEEEEEKDEENGFCRFSRTEVRFLGNSISNQYKQVCIPITFFIRTVDPNLNKFYCQHIVLIQRLQQIKFNQVQGLSQRMHRIYSVICVNSKPSAAVV